MLPNRLRSVCPLRHRWHRDHRRGGANANATVANRRATHDATVPRSDDADAMCDAACHSSHGDIAAVIHRLVHSARQRVPAHARHAARPYPVEPYSAAPNVTSPVSHRRDGGGRGVAANSMDRMDAGRPTDCRRGCRSPSRGRRCSDWDWKVRDDDVTCDLDGDDADISFRRHRCRCAATMYDKLRQEPYRGLPRKWSYTLSRPSPPL